MTDYSFRPAKRTQAKLRMAIGGPSGSGKTYTALVLARYLIQGLELEPKIALIDTERGSSQKYEGEPEIPPFDVVDLQSFAPEHYIAAVEAAARGRYPLLIIDSLSHGWAGPEGILEFVDTKTATSKAHNPYTDGWRQGTPLHNKLVNTLLQYPGHLLVTVRSKIARVLVDNGRGQQVPKIVGMEWVQRADLDYEFDVAGELDKEHNFVINKTRCRALNGKVFAMPGADLGRVLVTWLHEGAPSLEPDPSPSPAPREPVGPATRPVSPAPSTRPTPASSPNGQAPSPPVTGKPAPGKPATGKATATADPEAGKMQDELRGRLQKLALSKLRALYPGDDATSKQDRADTMRECYGVAGYTAFQRLELPALRAGWAKLKDWTKVAPPLQGDDDVPSGAEEEAGGVALESEDGPERGPDFLREGDDVDDEEPVDDASVTAWLLEHLRREAQALGQARALEDWLLERYGNFLQPDGSMLLDEETREGFMVDLLNELPELAATFPD